MDIPQRRQYAEKWLQAKHITSEQHRQLVTPKASTGWLQGCAKILKTLPKGSLPAGIATDARRSNSNAAFFHNLPYDNLIIDEASRCIDHKSKRSNIVELLSARAKRVYLLSGTLCVGRPTDMFMPMNILSHDILSCNWTQFVKTYCKTSAYNKHIITGYKNLDKLKLYVDPHIISKTRSECLDLPERVFVERYYDLSPEMRLLYNAIATQSEVHAGTTTIPCGLTLVKIAKCLQVLSGFVYYNERSKSCNSCDRLLDCIAADVQPGSADCGNPEAQKSKRLVHHLKSNPKLQLLQEDLEDLGNEKAIIWAWYQEDLAAISALLKEKGIPFIMAGEKNSAARFEADTHCNVFLGQTVQGIGITLNSATCTIYYSHGAALEPRLQSMDRNYRIGQRNKVVVKDYLARGTVEEMLVRLLQHKTDVKTFMQESIACMACDTMLHCQERHVQYLQRGCRHFGERRKAETIQTLKIREIA